MRILLVEDDRALAEGLQKALSEQHYLVDLAPDGETGWEYAEALGYDLILLDLLLPKLDGIHFCQKLRRQGNQTPLLLMTAQESSTKKVEGLDAGADDYLVKPFEISELLARVRALLRRGQDAQTPILEWSELRLDPSNCQVTYQQQLLKLTAKEYSLLELLLRYPQRIFSGAALLDHLWCFEDPPCETAVRTQIKGLRQKLKRAGMTCELIETIYGLGYRLKPPPPPKIVTPQPIPAAQINLSMIWKKHREQYLQRIGVVEKAIRALQQGTLEPILRQQALSQVHTLIGSLGSFGFKQASGRCRQLEQILHLPAQYSVENKHLLSDLILNLYQDLSLVPASMVNGLSVAAAKSSTRRRRSQTQLLIVDDDTALASAIANYATNNQMQPQIADSPDKARQLMQLDRPDIILLDLSFPESTVAGLEFLRELNTQLNAPPVIVFTAKQSFADRVKVARLGGQGFLDKPVDPATVIHSLQQVLQPSASPQAKLLLVDDNPQVLDKLRKILKPWGFNLTLLDDPQQFWQTLEQCQPDVVLLDLEMPNFSGLDLCQVIRNDPKWQQLPILILLPERHDQTVAQVYIAGADDYIEKPIIEPELIARLLHCIQRSHNSLSA
ncbi:MAG: response regulator [Microcoleaceae cyanobacterium]